MSEKIEFRYGKISVIHGDPVISRSIEVYGEWAQNEIEVLAAFIEPGDTVLDIGAFIGTHTLAFSHLVGDAGSVYSFEPRPEIFAILADNVRYNKRVNVSLRMNAVGQSDGLLCVEPINLNDGKNFGGLSLNQSTGGSTNETRSVQCLSIDSMDLPSVSLMKIDVEGMEPEVLAGARSTLQRDRPVIAVECNSLEIGLKLLDFAEHSGYIVYGLLFDAFNRNNFRKESSNFFGIARELSLLLLPEEAFTKFSHALEKYRLPLVDSSDSLALLLLHKPQYGTEVLEKTTVGTVLGVGYLSPYERVTIENLQVELNAVGDVVAEEHEAISRILYELAQKQERIDQQDETLKLLNARTKGMEDLEHRVKELEGKGEELERIRGSRSWRVTAPLRMVGRIIRQVKRSLKMSASFGRPPDAGSSWKEYEVSASTPRHSSKTIDVIVPVYKGLEETRLCIESVLSSNCRSPFELVVVNDCSPDANLTEWLIARSESAPFTLITNPQNLGFVGAVNRGMSLHPDRDVVLLNSDAVVANDWLDRLFMASQYDPEIGTVTPFSNNATICSYPTFCEDNALPEKSSLSELDAIFRRATHGLALEIPTGVGFCLYIKRQVLDRIGLFDMEKFGRGYGEENDFCQRAIRAGYKNILACNVFVQHLGAVSFGDEASPGKEKAMETLRSIHPNYERDIHRFIMADPIKKFRIAVDLERLRSSIGPVILHVSHNRGGGTQRHIEEISRLIKRDSEHLLLRPVMGTTLVQLLWMGGTNNIKIDLSLPTQYETLKEIIKAIGVSFVHYHHTIGIDESILQLANKLQVPYVFTAHDYYSVCPQISLTTHEDIYCGELGTEQCRQCLSRSHRQEDIVQWRNQYAEFLTNAEEVLAPSNDVASRLLRYYPNLHTRVVPHPEFLHSARVSTAPRKKRLRFRIVVLGALSKIKGADLLEMAAIDARERNLPIEYVLIGYGYRDFSTKTGNFLTVTGPYDDHALPSLLSEEAPDLVWFPAVWPETYSYTLSAAIAGGYPIAAPDLGAFPERLAEHGNTYILSWNMSPQEFNDWVVKTFASPDAPPRFVSRKDIYHTSPYYGTVYLEIGSRSVPVIADKELMRYGETVVHTEPRHKSTRRVLLQILYSLRGCRHLSWISKRIPHNIQRRVRDKLGS